MFLALFSTCLAAIDETQFASGRFCDCAVNPGRCNPNCFCDPYCTDFEKSTFKFALPEQTGAVKISCDPNGYIGKKNAASVQQIQINNVTCYLIEENPADLPRVTSYTPADFGVTAWNDLASVPPNTTTWSATNYSENDPIILGATNAAPDAWGAGLIPVAFGSHQCNMLIPLAYQLYFPETACTLPLTTIFESQVPVFFGASKFYFAPVPGDRTQTRENEILDGYITYVDDVSAMTLYLTPAQANGTVDSIGIERVEVSAQGYPKSQMVLVSRVLPSTTDAGVVYVTCGYYVGSNIRAAVTVNDNAQDPNFVFLSANGQDILFGINSAFLMNMTWVTMNRTLCMSDYPWFWGSLGNIVRRADQSYNNVQIIPQIIYTQDANVVNPQARWTFLYRKFGYQHKWFYALVGITCDVLVPPPPTENVDTTTYQVTLETVFTELTEDCSARYLPAGEPEYTASLSMVFDVFFERQGDSLEAIGILACFAILGTIWSYVVFYFDNW